jgi:hypothetical protein
VVALAFAGCFLALALLAGLVAASGRHWLLRLPILAVTPVLAVAVWWQVSQRDGLPVGGQPPDGSSFVAGLVSPPTPTSSGAIYLWAQLPGATTPKAFRVPYSPTLEQQIAQASAQARKGAKIAVGSSSASKGRPGHASGRSASRTPPGGLRFYRLPAPTLEPKAKGQ